MRLRRALFLIFFKGAALSLIGMFAIFMVILYSMSERGAEQFIWGPGGDVIKGIALVWFLKCVYEAFRSRAT